MSYPSITFTYYPRPARASGRSASHSFSGMDDFCRRAFCCPQKIQLPIFRLERQIACVPCTFAYSHPPFKKSKAILQIASGPLKGKAIIIDANKDDGKNINTCLDRMMKEVIEPYFRPSALEVRKMSAGFEPEVKKALEAPEEPRPSIGEIAEGIHGEVEKMEAVLEGTQAFLKQSGLGSSEALHRGACTLSKIAKVADGLIIADAHAPHGILNMSFRNGIEAIVDFAAKSTFTAGAIRATIAFASLALGGPPGHMLKFALGAGAAGAGSEIYSEFIQGKVNEFGEEFSKVVVSMPEEMLKEAQRDRALMKTFVDSLCVKIEEAVRSRPEKSRIPIEFDLTTGKGISISQVRGKTA